MAKKKERKQVAVVHVYRDATGSIRYRGHAEDGDVVTEPRTVFENRMEATEILQKRFRNAKIVYSAPKF